MGDNGFSELGKPRLEERIEELLTENNRLRAALRAARPCVFNSRYGSWEEVLRLVDAALSGEHSPERRGG